MGVVLGVVIMCAFASIYRFLRACIYIYIYICVCMSTIVYGKPIQSICMSAELRSPNTRMLKVSFGSLKQSADYNFTWNS